MQMVGGGKLHEYGPLDERPHAPGAQSNWQESYVLMWWDFKHCVGGMHRLGHEPHYEGGQSVIWSTVYTPEHIFHRVSQHPLKAADRTDRCMSGDDGALTYCFDDRCVWTLKEPDLQATLRVDDFHPAFDGYLKDGAPQLQELSSNHIEVSSRVTGELSVKGKRYPIDGLAIRDKGWGPRDWNTVWAHRWGMGVLDRNNSFVALTAHMAGDRTVNFGWVVRGDKVIYADKVHTVAHMAGDGATNLGGKVLMVLSTGERFETRFEPLAPARLSNRQSTAVVDCACRVTWGDLVGFGCFETSNNLHAGTRQPTVLDGGIVANGWTRRTNAIE